MQSRIWRLVTLPTSEPVTLAELKSHLRVDHNAEDALIALYAQSARQAVEDECAIALCPQSWRLDLDGWPDDGFIELPRPPLQTIVSFTWRDSTGAPYTLGGDVYRAQSDAAPGRVELMPGARWPTATLDAPYPITIEYIAGYADAAAIPPAAKAAILLLTGELYQNREAVSGAGALVQTPAIQRLLALLQVAR